MPGIDASIPLGIKPPDQMQGLSSLLNVAKGAQDVQGQGISLQEKRNLQQVMADPSNYMDDSGNVDPVKAQKVIMTAAPTTGLPVLQGLLTAQKQHTEATAALSNLADQDRQRIAGVVATFKPDTPPDLVNKSMDALDKSYGGRLTPAVNLFRAAYPNALQQGPQAVQNLFDNTTRSVLSPLDQKTLATPSGVSVSDGATTQVTNTNQFAQGAGGQPLPVGAAVPGTVMPQKLGPGQLESVDQDSQGNRFIVTRTQSGAIVGTRPLDNAAPAAPGAAPAPGPFRLPQGESQKTYDEFNNKRIATNNAAGTVAEQQFNNNQVIKLAKTATLGQDYGGLVKGFTGHFAGLPGTTQGTIDYDKIEHFLALQQGTLANQAGFNSDASRSIADRQAGSAHGTAEGVQSIARTNRALATGIDLYNTGNENAIKAAGNSPFAQRAFQQQWAHTLDFDALRLYDAAKNAKTDPDGRTAIIHELGGVGSDRYKAALAKIGPMRKLILGQ